MLSENGAKYAVFKISVQMSFFSFRYSEVEVTDDYLMNIIAFQSHERKEGLKLYVK